jgi:hypothetical protein
MHIERHIVFWIVALAVFVGLLWRYRESPLYTGSQPV